jgi:D-glycero-alpha-D-manno-heptose 1-phosphate guanylyltransferase
MNYFQDAWNKLEIRYSIEDEPLGTGGAIKRSLDFCRSENVFVFNGDTLFMIDFYGMLAKMEQMSADLVIALREISNANRYGRVDTDETGKITNFREKTADAAAGLINGGIYLIKRSVIDKGGLPDTFSIEKEFFPDLCKKGAIYGVPFNDYFLDIGIPEDLDKARFEFPTLAKQYGILS